MLTLTQRTTNVKVHSHLALTSKFTCAVEANFNIMSMVTLTLICILLPLLLHVLSPKNANADVDAKCELTFTGERILTLWMHIDSNILSPSQVFPRVYFGFCTVFPFIQAMKKFAKGSVAM